MDEEAAVRRAVLFGLANVVLVGLASLAEWVAWLGENSAGLRPTTPDAWRALGVVAAVIGPGLVAVGVCLGVLRITERRWSYRLVAAGIAALVAGAVRLVVLVRLRFAPPDSWFLAAEGGFGVVVVLAVVLLPVYDHELIARARREEALRVEQEHRAQEARRQAEEAELEVRRDVSRRLHGTVQQRLVLASAELAAVAKAVDGPTAERLRDVVGDLDEVREQDVRELSRSLLPLGVEIGVREALYVSLGRLPASVATHVTVSEQLQARLDDPTARRLSVPERILVLDVVEEAVTNAVRHGGAHAIDLHLHTEPAQEPGDAPTFVMTVDDDGPGPSADVALSGLARLDERAARSGGSVRLSVAPGGGGRVLVRLPVTQTADGLPSAGPSTSRG